jgi:hypothetical protein
VKSRYTALSFIENTCTGWLRFLLVTGFMLLLECSGNAQSQNTGNGGFVGRPEMQTSAVDSVAAPAISEVRLFPATVIGGNSSRLRVTLTQAAPLGGIRVTLISADPSLVTTPASVTVARGHTQASVVLTTAAASAAASVGLTASSNGATAGATLTVTPPKAAPFTVKLAPSALTIEPGSSASDQVSTKAGASFDNALSLDAPNPPAGVTVNFTPSLITAPGSGTSQVNVNVDSSVAAGKYSIKITASDGTALRTATLKLTVGAGSSSGPVGTLKGCTLKMSGHKYQAVEFSLNEAATVDFNGTLYFGATCDPNRWADQFGFGNPLALGGFGYTFWFSDFADQLNTSAIWTVGNQTSQCVDYSAAPDC